MEQLERIKDKPAHKRVIPVYEEEIKVKLAEIQELKKQEQVFIDEFNLRKTDVLKVLGTSLQIILQECYTKSILRAIQAEIQPQEECKQTRMI